MDLGENGRMEYSLKNKKRAYGAMCRVTILLFVFMLLSETTTYASVHFLGTFDRELEMLLVRLFMLFGAESSVSIVAARNLLSSEAMYEVLQMLLSIITMVIPTAIFAKAARIDGNGCFNVKGKCIKGMLPMVGLCQTTITFVLLFSSFIETLFVSPAFVVADNTAGIIGSSEFNLFGFLITVISNSIFVPVIEEYVFRGVIFSYLRKYGISFAVVASSLVFGIAHSIPTQSVFAFAFGMFSAFLVVVTGNIKSSVIFHAINNFIYVVDGYAVGTRAEPLVNALEICLLGLSVAGIYYMLKKGGHMETFRERAHEQDKELVIYPGMYEAMAVPVVVYLLIYAAKYIFEMMM